MKVTGHKNQAGALDRQHSAEDVDTPGGVIEYEILAVKYIWGSPDSIRASLEAVCAGQVTGLVRHWAFDLLPLNHFNLVRI